ncbi:MAG: caspase family protein [Bacteroidota bacterium]
MAPFFTTNFSVRLPLLTILFVVVYHSCSYGQCLSGDCINGYGAFKLAEGAQYTGTFKNGKFDGVGNCLYTDGSEYEGEWKNGLPEGKGLKIAPNGKQTVGVWKQGLMIEELYSNNPALRSSREKKFGCISGDCKNGQGIYAFRSGALYIGDFKKGEIHGVGVCHFSNGSRYNGEWQHRYPHGKGTKFFLDGTQRTGYWKKGMAVDESGRPINTTAPGAVSNSLEIQSGCLVGNCKNGEGILAYPDGSRYEGFFAKGLPSISGTFHYPQGDKYVGAFKNGVPHGVGRLYAKGGNVTSGRWLDGEYIDQQEQVNWENLGCIRGNCQNGTGTYMFEDGAKYIGQFYEGLPNGKGTVFYPNSERYEGSFQRGAFEGFGVLFQNNGTQVSGLWKAGNYIGSPPETTPTVSAPTNAPAPSRPSTKVDVKIWAVIVGVAAYNHMPVLRYTDDDAYRIYAFLKSPEGGALDDSQIRILIDEDATLFHIKQTMKEVFGKAGANDLVLLYFSGHGLKGAFLPFDFDGYQNKLEHSEINRILRTSKAKYKLCVADACHSGSLVSNRSGDLSGTLDGYYNAIAKARSGTALIMSSKSNETSLESSGLRQGVFSHFFIRALKGEADRDGNRAITVQELFDFVKLNVRTYTRNRQSPILRGDYDPNLPIAFRRR